MRYLACLASALLAFSVLQDPVVVSPKMVSVVFENDRVRVLRVQLGPHERIESHSHPGLVVVPLTSGSRRIYSPDESHKDMSATIGDVHWRDPSTHSVENLLDTPSENIEIEFKNAAAPALPVTLPEKISAPRDSSAAVAIEKEAYHRVVLENQYVRIVDVRIPPGQTTLFHMHQRDNVSVRVSGGLTQGQIQGKDWNPSKQNERGSVNFSNGSKQPYTHRIKNLGTDIYHVIDVELLP